MSSSLRRMASLIGVFGFVAVVVTVVIGCSGMNPFLTTTFLMNSDLQTRQSQTFPQGSTGTQTDTTVLSSVCNLAAGPDRTLQVTIENQSTNYVTFSMTFVASAGPGGFVCDDAIAAYQNAGYTYLGTSNTGVIGCDTVLLGGTRLLVKEFGINQGNAARLDPATVSGTTVTPTTLPLRGADGSVFIPLPQVIVFGNSDPNFLCSGTDLCSQRGFVYTTAANVTVGKWIEASRIQGTVCNTNSGVAPEWRLDLTTLDGTSQLYQYAYGGSIVVSILDRSADPVSTTRNQAVWVVTDSTGTTIHNQNP